MSQPAPQMPHRPTVAHSYNSLTDGGHNTETSRQFGDAVKKVCPEARVLAAAGRDFMPLVVRDATKRGIAQILDLGCGYPPLHPGDAVHAVAQSVQPTARTVYVDHDAEVVNLRRQRAGNDPSTEALHRDIVNVDAVLGSPEIERFDRGQPSLILMGFVLHLIADEQDPGAVVKRYFDFAAPGSWLVIVTPCSKTPLESKLVALEGLYRSVGLPWTLRNRFDIATLLSGMEVAEPGLVPPRVHYPQLGPPEEYEDAVLAAIIKKR